MKINLFVFILFFVQKNYSQITGRVTSSSNQQIVFANVMLLKYDDSLLLKTVQTDEKGEFNFQHSATGKYFLRITSVGYQTWNSPEFELNNIERAKNFGTITMKDARKELDEVVVHAQKPLFQQLPEGTVINVESDILTKGSSALQVLERSPGVVLDYQNNSISLNGKSGVMVMIDGKLLRMTMEQVIALLNGMSADDIEKIELLNTPPSKYDAEGNAGLINIILKKNKKLGTNGTASLTGGYGWREKAMASVNVGHNTGNLNLFGTYTFSHNRSYMDLDITSSQNMPFLGGDVNVRYWDTARILSNSHDATIGADIKLSKKTSIGANLNFMSNTLSGSTVTHAGYNVLPDSLILFDGINSGANNWKNLISSVYFENKISEKEKIAFDLDYLYYNNKSHGDVQSSFTDKHGAQAGGTNLFAPAQRGFASTAIKVTVAKIDYAKQLDKKTKIESGIKGSFTTNSSISGIESLLNGEWVSNDETTNQISMNEFIGAAYISTNTQINSSTSITAGFRYEYATMNADNTKTGENIVDRHLSNLFPSLFFSRKISGNAELQLSYTKRISRPSYNDLASYVGYADPTALYTGNPFLKPTITHNIKVGYNYKSYFFSVLFSRDNSPIVRYQLTESPSKDILYISPQNMNWQNNISFQGNLPFRINSWWNMNFNLSARITEFKLDFTKYPLTKTYFAYFLNSTQTFKLPKNFTAEISGWYNSSGYDGTKKVEAFGSLNLGIKKELKNNAGSFQLSISDILKTQIYDLRYGAITQEAFAIQSHVIVTTESAKSPIIKITYTRSFGNNTPRLSSKMDSGSDDERDRIRKE